MADLVDYVVALSRRHFDEIGFLPESVLRDYFTRGHLLHAEENGEPCGFIVWGDGWPVLRVFQVCIQYDAQRRLHGARLVGQLIAKAEADGYESISCWVADDIPANDFWEAMGFRRLASRPGGRRRARVINGWLYWCKSPHQGSLLVRTA